jgi:hypothetical protein
MNSLQKKYIQYFLTQVQEILRDPKKIQAAKHSYTQGNLHAPRYHINFNISNPEHWSANERLSLTAALFEAAATSDSLFITSPERTKEIQDAKVILLTKIVPMLTNSVNEDCRLASVQEHIALLLARWAARTTTTSENRHSWFSLATASALAISATAAVLVAFAGDRTDTRSP